jgi:hypothetical protein
MNRLCCGGGFFYLSRRLFVLGIKANLSVLLVYTIHVFV